MIPFLDLQAGYHELKTEIDLAVKRVLQSGVYILGDEVEYFETEFAAFCESQYAVGVASGLDALRLALMSVGVGPGDEVIVPSHTFIATWLAVSQCGAIPVPVEPVNDGYNLDPALVEVAITERTKAIIPVHLYGMPADLDPVSDIAQRYGLRVVEDAAQAHGARYKGRRIGAHSDVACWSFYPGKNLGAIGDGGAITTDNKEIADSIRILRNYGSREKYINELQGYNSRLDPLQAAILRVKLQSLDEWNARRRAIALRYSSELAECGISLPSAPAWNEPVWHLYVARHHRRDFLQKELASAGIATLIHYPIPPHLQLAYENQAKNDGNLPIAEQLASEVLSLPIGPHLRNDQVTQVIDAIKRLSRDL